MKIIIPMTGMSKRFKREGIKTPKQFLKVNNKMIIEHILDMFPGEEDINFIVNRDEYEDKELKKYFSKISNYKMVKIEYQKSGPGGALLKSKLLETKSPVLINYCDFSNIWDWEKFKLYILNNNPDGVVPSYFGLHPHSIYGNNYAFIQNQKDKVLSIKEKKPFTSNKINEFASSGTYYFKSGELAKKYIKKVFELEKYINGEVYISTPYEEMIKDNLDIRLYEIKYFFQWGTPEDYYEFIYNLNEVENVKLENKIDLNNINLLIPAAGEGSRFKNMGYKESKIYLDLNNSSIIVEILNCFKNQLQTKVLILEKDFNKEILSDNKFDFERIRKTTEGQAASALKLIEKIENNEAILIHSADCILDKSTDVKIGDYDIVVYTKNNYRRAFEQELNYGWINQKENLIESLSIKSPPKSRSSNVIIGTFLFKNKDIFKELYTETCVIKKDQKEIHIDHLVETAINKGYKVHEEYSDSSVMLGTPLEYELFKYMKNAHEYLNIK